MPAAALPTLSATGESLWLRNSLDKVSEAIRYESNARIAALEKQLDTMRQEVERQSVGLGVVSHEQASTTRQVRVLANDVGQVREELVQKRGMLHQLEALLGKEGRNTQDVFGQVEDLRRALRAMLERMVLLENGLEDRLGRREVAGLLTSVLEPFQTRVQLTLQQYASMLRTPIQAPPPAPVQQQPSRGGGKGTGMNSTAASAAGESLPGDADGAMVPVEGLEERIERAVRAAELRLEQTLENRWELRLTKLRERMAEREAAHSRELIAERRDWDAKLQESARGQLQLQGKLSDTVRQRRVVAQAAEEAKRLALEAKARIATLEQDLRREAEAREELQRSTQTMISGNTTNTRWFGGGETHWHAVYSHC